MPVTRILVVDDHEPSRRLLVDFLGAGGYSVITADTGAAAIALAHQARLKLIVLDLVLPDLSGLDIARSLKSRPETAKIPILAVTAQAMLGDAQRAMESGCDAYLPKPVRLRDLTVLISALVSRRIPPHDGGPLAGVLPSTGSKIKWSPRRKALLVIAIRSGMISLRDACERYFLSPDELSHWRGAFDRDGIAGLYSTKQRRRPRA
jgi:two-component system, cell cycle response regulator DivK